MRTRAVIVAALAVGACTARAGSPALMRDVERLADPAMAGREAGTEDERAAADYVAAELRAVGLEPHEQAVEYGNGSRNVWALLPGASDDVIVVGAHLDHLGRRDGRLYPGADDDASGVATVLAAARELTARRGELGRSILFAFFGAEEAGMVGSRAFVADPPIARARMTAMVNVDMVARPLQDDRLYRVPMALIGVDRGGAVGLYGTRHYPGLRRIADDAFAAVDGETVAAEDFPAVIDQEIEAQAAGRSDSVSFADVGIPTLFFGDGESRDYHKPTDTPEVLDRGLFAQNARGIVRTVLALSTAPDEAFVRSAAPPPRRKPPRGLYLPIGVSTGVSLRPGAGWIIGGEASLVRLWSGSLAYTGVYADALHDTATGANRVSIGPEVGQSWLGVDAGYLVELDGSSVARHGLAARAFVTLSAVSVSLRLGWLEGGRGTFGELGIQLKLPLALHTRSRP